MKSKIEINISVIDDGPVVMRCQGQNTSKGKALDALEDAYLSTVAQLMSKDKCRMSRKRFCKKAAGKHGVQVQEVRDIVREERVNPLKRRQEKRASAKHQAGKQEGKAV